jgi:hypothetical protein
MAHPGLNPAALALAVRTSAVMRRRVAQGRAEKEAQMFEPAGRVSALPAWREQRSVPEGPTNPARLSFPPFSLAKQRKWSRPPGRDPAGIENKTNQKKPLELRRLAPFQTTAIPAPSGA